MTSTHIIVCQIERIVHPTSFRKTPWAKFQTPAGYFLVDAWFEDGQPKMQIRSNVESDNPLEVAVNCCAGDSHGRRLADGDDRCGPQRAAQGRLKVVNRRNPTFS